VQLAHPPAARVHRAQQRGLVRRRRRAQRSLDALAHVRQAAGVRVVAASDHKTLVQVAHERVHGRLNRKRLPWHYRIMSQDRVFHARALLLIKTARAKRNARMPPSQQTTFYTQPRLEHRKQLKLGENYCLCVCAKSVLVFGNYLTA
jgi:hypothetical protein